MLAKQNDLKEEMFMQFENRQGQAQQMQAGGFFQAADPRLAHVDESAVNAYVVKVFGWMFFGLLVTTVTTVAIVVGIGASPAFGDLVFSMLQFPGILIVFAVQLGLVWVISARVMSMNPGTAKLLYVLYASLNGLTVGLIAILFSMQIGGMDVLAIAFGLTAASFGIMALYGYLTGRDLTSMGSLLTMALIGLILIMVVNMFLRSDTMGLAISIVGLFIFLGLVAADTNKIKNHFARVALGSTDESRAAMGTQLDQQALASNLAIVGALMLYLDFINIFLFILRILGNRR